MDCSPPGSSVHGILQVRILEWVASPSSRGSSPPQGANPWLVCLLHWQAGSVPLAPPSAAAKSLQSCPTLCDPRDGSPPAPLSLGFSRQEHWSGLPFPSSMHESEKWKWSRDAPNQLSVQFFSVAESCLTLCNPMNRSTPGLPVHHQLPEFTQTHVHQVSDAISSSAIPFSSCPQCLPASESFPVSQLFTWGGLPGSSPSWSRVFEGEMA